jgi:hypothetical protein
MGETVLTTIKLLLVLVAGESAAGEAEVQDTREMETRISRDGRRRIVDLNYLPFGRFGIAAIDAHTHYGEMVQVRFKSKLVDQGIAELLKVMGAEVERPVTALADHMMVLAVGIG